MKEEVQQQQQQQGEEDSPQQDHAIHWMKEILHLQAKLYKVKQEKRILQVTNANLSDHLTEAETRINELDHLATQQQEKIQELEQALHDEREQHKKCQQNHDDLILAFQKKGQACSNLEQEVKHRETALLSLGEKHDQLVERLTQQTVSLQEVHHRERDHWKSIAYLSDLVNELNLKMRRVQQDEEALADGLVSCLLSLSSSIDSANSKGGGSRSHDLLPISQTSTHPTNKEAGHAIEKEQGLCMRRLVRVVKDVREKVGIWQLAWQKVMERNRQLTKVVNYYENLLPLVEEYLEEG
eukprot:scaffold21_cov179-Ochromonas_danica.AAC.8